MVRTFYGVQGLRSPRADAIWTSDAHECVGEQNPSHVAPEPDGSTRFARHLHVSVLLCSIMSPSTVAVCAVLNSCVRCSRRLASSGVDLSADLLLADVSGPVRAWGPMAWSAGRGALRPSGLFCRGYTRLMFSDNTKALLFIASSIAVFLAAIAIGITSVLNWIVVACVAVAPPLVRRFWRAPEQTIAERINEARR